MKKGSQVKQLHKDLLRSMLLFPESLLVDNKPDRVTDLCGNFENISKSLITVTQIKKMFFSG